MKKFKRRLKELTCRKKSGTVTGRIVQINQVTRGWINYYALGAMKTAMTEIDAHLRTRIRIIIWKQWKVPKNGNGDCRSLELRKTRQDELLIGETDISLLPRNHV